MFDDRYVPQGHFQVGEKVWVVYRSRIQKASVTSIPSVHTGGGLLTVRVEGLPGNRPVNMCDVFKRPTEYHLLKAAADGLIEDLQRDCRNLLVASS